eukprot:TRINITY_DN10598_c0_g1_i1.p1 TRINITY_DN10598_c0_g1~~TRINITY_DN10598_c0_g1_i1.p1  ORF type:complete len:265 (-),score=49.57 TRINITY_DN10598_c0_g1_i1:13-807(-)
MVLGLLLNSWVGFLLFFTVLPVNAILIGFLISFLTRPYAIDGYTFRDEVEFVRKNLLALLPGIAFSAILFRSTAQLTNYSREYSTNDLLFCPLYICLYLFIDDTSYYWGHRAMHKFSFLWDKVHKMHHTPDFSGCMEGLYAHPFEGVCHFFLPAVVHLTLYKQVHAVNFMAALSVQFFLGFFLHSASSKTFLPESVVLHPLRHEVHHKAGRGNYAQMFTFWDWVMDSGVHQGEEVKYLMSVMKPNKVNAELFDPAGAMKRARIE